MTRRDLPALILALVGPIAFAVRYGTCMMPLAADLGALHHQISTTRSELEMVQAARRDWRAAQQDLPALRRIRERLEHLGMARQGRELPPRFGLLAGKVGVQLSGCDVSSETPRATDDERISVADPYESPSVALRSEVNPFVGASVSLQLEGHWDRVLAFLDSLPECGFPMSVVGLELRRHPERVLVVQATVGLRVVMGRIEPR